MDEKKKCKPYIQDEEHTVPDRVNEPAVAYGVDVDALKALIIEGVNNIDDVKKLKQLDELVESMAFDGKKGPCQYTREELVEHLRRSEEDIRMGRTYTLEEIKAQHKWLR